MWLLKHSVYTSPCHDDFFTNSLSATQLPTQPLWTFLSVHSRVVTRWPGHFPARFPWLLHCLYKLYMGCVKYLAKYLWMKLIFLRLPKTEFLTYFSIHPQDLILYWVYSSYSKNKMDIIQVKKRKSSALLNPSWKLDCYVHFKKRERTLNMQNANEGRKGKLKSWHKKERFISSIKGCCSWIIW